MNTFSRFSLFCVGVAFTSLGLSPSVSAQKRAITPPSQQPRCFCGVNVTPNDDSAEQRSSTSHSAFAVRGVNNATTAPTISDGVFREYRLAVYMTNEGFRSEQLNQDVSKVKAFWKELETFLNNIYVRDLGVRFTIVQDERLIEKSYKGSYAYDAGTKLINAAIGSDAYDIGIVVNYIEGGALQGLASPGGVKFQDRKGWAIVNSQEMITIGHELGHLFGADHPFVGGAGLVGRCTEPKSGQSMMSYGYPYKEDFISLESLRMMQPVTKASDFKLPTEAKHASPTNTAPRIDRSKMRAEYRVPKGTFFTIPVYATDAEQSSLLYAFNQFGCHSGNPATFPVFPPQHDAKLSFGRRYGGASMIANSDEIPVGNYQFWLSVSDALPVEEAIAKKQAPLYDGYIANVKVVNATPFKITSNIASQYAMGQKLTLKWSVDKTFFKEGSKVRVVMSDDFGETFSHVLVPSTANDGECEVYIPQKLMEKFSTYFNIWFAGKGLIRLETIDDDFQYYDISNNALVDGGIEVVKSPVTFEGLPTNNYLKLAADAPLPPAPQVTAKVNNAPVVPSFSETTEGNMTIRTWRVQQGGEVYGGQQFIEREAAETPEIPETPKEVKVQQITLTPSASSVVVGESLQIAAKVLPENATNTTLKWKITPENILKPTAAPGQFTAQQVGEALVRAEAADGSGITAECKVVVKPRLVQSISLNATQKELIIGDSFTLTATLSPENATNRNVIWKLVSGNAISLSNTGVIQAKQVGEALVRAETADGSGITAECKVVVKPRLVQTISLNSTKKDLLVGESFALTATAMPENATNRNVIWKLVSGDAISLSADGVIQAKKVGVALVRAEAADGSGITAECKVVVKPRLVQAISLNATQKELIVSDAFSLTATAMPENATNRNVVWKLVSGDAISLSNTGVIQAKKVGEALVRAEAADGSGITAECKVVVKPRLVQAISLNATQKELIVSDAFSLTATAMPENATNRNVVWKLVSGDAISLSNTGVIQAKKVGEALIRAEAADGSGVSAECKVVVKPHLVQAISLNATQKNLIIGDSFTLTATLSPENATNHNVVWKLVSGDAISLSNTGVIQAKKVGEALVRAEAADGSGVSAECKVVVKPRLVQSISLNTTQKELIVGDAFSLTATLSPENATNRNVIWKLVSGDAISLSNTGVIQAKKVGAALVRAEAEDGSGITAECKVVVKPRLVQEISLKLEKDTVAVGEHFTVTADVLPKNATNSTLQWSVSDPLLLKHLGAGSFETLKTGSATITAQARDGSKQEASCRIEIVPPTALKKAVAADVAPQVSVDGNTLVVKQVPSGQWLRVLDVQGRLLHQVKSYGEPLRIAFPQMPQVLLLKVAQRSYKVLLAQP